MKTLLSFVLCYDLCFIFQIFMGKNQISSACIYNYQTDWFCNEDIELKWLYGIICHGKSSNHFFLY